MNYFLWTKHTKLNLISIQHQFTLVSTLLSCVNNEKGHLSWCVRHIVDLHQPLLMNQSFTLGDSKLTRNHHKEGGGAINRLTSETSVRRVETGLLQLLKSILAFVKYVRPKSRIDTPARVLFALCDWIWCNNRSIWGKQRWANRATEEKIILSWIYPALRNKIWKQWALGFTIQNWKCVIPVLQSASAPPPLPGFPSRLELQLFSLEDDKCLPPMFIHALPAHHINQTLLKKKGQRHGDDIEMKTYHFTFAPRSLCHCHWI